MVNSAKLKGLMKEKNLRQEDVAKMLKISKTAFNYKLNNKSEFLSSEIEKLCEKLDINDSCTMVKIFFAKECELKSQFA